MYILLLIIVCIFLSVADTMIILPAVLLKTTCRLAATTIVDLTLSASAAAMPRRRLPNFDQIRSRELNDVIDICVRCYEEEGLFRREAPAWWQQHGWAMTYSHEHWYELNAVLRTYPLWALSPEIRLHFEDLEAYMEIQEDFPPEWERDTLF